MGSSWRTRTCISEPPGVLFPSPNSSSTKCDDLSTGSNANSRCSLEANQCSDLVLVRFLLKPTRPCCPQATVLTIFMTPLVPPQIGAGSMGTLQHRRAADPRLHPCSVGITSCGFQKCLLDVILAQTQFMVLN